MQTTRSAPNAAAAAVARVPTMPPKLSFEQPLAVAVEEMSVPSVEDSGAEPLPAVVEVTVV